MIRLVCFRTVTAARFFLEVSVQEFLGIAPPRPCFAVPGSRAKPPSGLQNTHEREAANRTLTASSHTTNNHP